MSASNSSDAMAGISNKAVKKATGRTWTQWLAVLDKAGAKDMTHKAIAQHISKKYDQVNPWWSQMVTVGYEQARGLRQKHEKPDGFQISASRTINVPIETLYRAWSDKRRRGRWLDADITVRKTTTNKSMRMTWSDGTTSVDAHFSAKGDAKSQVALNHGKLPSAKAGERMKTFWREKLAELKALLEK